MSTESVMPSNHLILCHTLPPVFSLSLASVFSNESALCIKWPKYWSFSFSFSPSSEYSGLISFRDDWFDLLGVQGTLKSLLQHCSLKASILWCSAFFLAPGFSQCKLNQTRIARIRIWVDMRQLTRVNNILLCSHKVYV